MGGGPGSNEMPIRVIHGFNLRHRPKEGVSLSGSKFTGSPSVTVPAFSGLPLIEKNYSGVVACVVCMLLKEVEISVETLLALLYGIPETTLRQKQPQLDVTRIWDFLPQKWCRWTLRNTERPARRTLCTPWSWHVLFQQCSSNSTTAFRVSTSKTQSSNLLHLIDANLHARSSSYLRLLHKEWQVLQQMLAGPTPRAEPEV